MGAAPPTCVNCGKLISVHSAKYRGSTRCITCANKVKSGNFTTAGAIAAVARRVEIRRAERAELVRLRAHLADV